MDLALHLLAHAIFIGLAWHFGRRFERRLHLRKWFALFLALPADTARQVRETARQCASTDDLDFNLHRKGPG